MNMVPFIDRVDEINVLVKWSSSFRYVPLYIYGPEGCGKTRLLKEFVSMFRDFYGDEAFAIYIDALERESVEKALFTSTGISIALNIIAEIIDRSVGVGSSLIERISTLLEKIIGIHRLRDSYVVVAIDDVASVIGLDKVEWYVKWLFELMNKLNSFYRPRSINFIVTTSEGFSRELVSRHGHSHIVLMWNLKKEAYKEMFLKISPPKNIDFEDIWNTLGGNPRKLIELATVYTWDLKAMIKSYTVKAREIIEKVISMNLLQELKTFLEDIDAPRKQPSENMAKLVKILIERNMVTYIDWPTLTEEELKPDTAIGIGKAYAWQAPLFKIAIEKALKSI